LALLFTTTQLKNKLNKEYTSTSTSTLQEIKDNKQENITMFKKNIASYNKALGN
jgi:hypothetical protein